MESLSGKRALIVTAIAAAVLSALVTGGVIYVWQSDDGGEVSIAKRPKAGWEKYFPTPGTTTLLGEKASEVEELLGVPPVLARQGGREVWIYSPYDDDPTGIYLYFKAGKVVKGRLDEFNGLAGSSIWDEDEFWFD